MLLQTNSYLVPREKRAEHARLMRRLRQAMAALGCDCFEAYEQVGQQWTSGQATGRFVQFLRFRDRQHFLAVQKAERGDAAAQALIREFCELVNVPYQQEQGFFAIGYYNSVLADPVSPGTDASFSPAALGAGRYDHPVAPAPADANFAGAARMSDAQARAQAQLLGQVPPPSGNGNRPGTAKP